MLPEHPRYALGETIAKGDYATVFRGRDQELDREIAIKQIHAQYLDEPLQLKRYWQEAQLLANLEHPRIMTIYDIVRERGWLILELMLGTVPHVLRGHGIDLGDLRLLLLSMATALQFLEDNGIVHGDVKPSNMLVDKNRRFKLGDFGIARRLAGDSGSVVKGTTKYMAPEVVSAQLGDVGPHSDLYSLGFSAYELMCGKNFEALFPGLNMYGRDRQIAWIMWHSAPDRRLPPISRVLTGVPEDLARIVEKLCEKDLAKRYHTAQEVVDDLRKNASGEKQPIAAEQDKAAADAAARTQHARRKRRLTFAAAAVSLVFSTLLLVLPSGPKESPPVPVSNKDPICGNLVHVDTAGHRFELRLTTGERKVISFTPQVDEVSLNGTELRDFSQLREGDKSDVRPVQTGGQVFWQFKFTRETPPEASALGVIAHVAATQLTVTVPRAGTPGEPLQAFVSSAVSIRFNGQETLAARPFALADLQPGDRIELRYVAGQGDLEARSIQAWRLIETKGLVETFKSPSQITLRLGTAPSSPTTLAVAQDCVVTLNGAEDQDGRKLTLDDLRKGDQVAIRYDSQVHRIAAQRELTFTGTIHSLGPDDRQLAVVRAGESPKQYVLSAQCEIKRHAQGATLPYRYLRVGDTVTMTQDASPGIARHVLVVPQADPRPWALIIAYQEYDDHRLSQVSTAGNDTQLIRETLVDYYRVAEDHLLSLTEGTRRTLEQEIPGFLQRIPDNSQLLVYYLGQAYVGQDRVPYLAPKEFDLDRHAETGLALPWLLTQLDDCAATEKLLLFDACQGGAGPGSSVRSSSAQIVGVLKASGGAATRFRKWQPAPGESAPQSGSTNGKQSLTFVLASCDDQQQDLTTPDGQHGLFAACLAEALRGKADLDRNRRLWRHELFRSVTNRMATLAVGSGQEQTPVLFVPSLERISPEAKESLQRLLVLLRRGRLDTSFSSAYEEAVVLTPKQPDARLMLALCRLKDPRPNPTQALKELRELVEDYPESAATNHILAWLLLRQAKKDKQDCQPSILCLARAVAHLPSEPDAYASHLFEFAGQSSAFAVFAVERAAPQDLQPLTQAVARYGKEEAMDPFRRGYEDVRKAVQNLNQQIAANLAANPGQAFLLTGKKNNLITYAKLDFSVLEAHLAAALDNGAP
ncbi:MAG: serine/threonine-protein kinase [Planctomycetota bacterium]|nr:serine/threonine-protein kinase [Planctomycetota bacterium]